MDGEGSMPSLGDDGDVAEGDRLRIGSREDSDFLKLLELLFMMFIRGGSPDLREERLGARCAR